MIIIVFKNMEYKYDNMIMHPNLSVGATNKKIYDVNN